MQRYSSTNYGAAETPEQNPEQIKAGSGRRILSARLEHIMACLQVCWQHLVARKVYMSKSGKRILVFSGDSPRQRLHSDFKKAFWNVESEEQPHDMQIERQTADYLARVSNRLKTPFWIFEGSHCSVREVHQSQVENPGLASVV